MLELARGHDALTFCQLLARGVTGQRLAETDDLPVEPHAALRHDAGPHRLAQALDVLGAGALVVDEEVTVHLRHLGAADPVAPAAGRIDEFPGAVAGRVLEGRAAGALLDGLVGFAILRNLVHLARDLGGVAGLALIERLGEHHVRRHAAMAVGEVHVRERQHADVALPVDAARLDENVLGLAAVGARVHAQRAAYGSRNAAIEGEPGNAGVSRGPR